MIKVLWILLVMGLLQPVYAGIKITPASIRLEANQSTYTIPLKLENTSETSTEIFFLSLVASKRDIEGGWLYPKPGELAPPLKWAMLSETVIRIKPEDSAKLALHLMLGDKPEGDHNLMILIDQDPSKMRQRSKKTNEAGGRIGTQVLSFMRIAVPVFIRKPSSRPQSISLNKLIQYQPLELHASTQGLRGITVSQVVENKGNFEVLIDSKCYARDVAYSGVVKEVEVPPRQVELLPNEERKIRCFMKGGIAKGEYAAYMDYDVQIRAMPAKKKWIKEKKFSVSSTLSKKLGNTKKGELNQIPLLVEPLAVVNKYIGKPKTVPVSIYNPTNKRLKLKLKVSKRKGTDRGVRVRLDEKILRLNPGERASVMLFGTGFSENERFFGFLEIKESVGKRFSPIRIPLAYMRGSEEEVSDIQAAFKTWKGKKAEQQEDKIQVVGLRTSKVKGYFKLDLLLHNKSNDFFSKLYSQFEMKSLRKKNLMKKGEFDFQEAYMFPGDKAVISTLVEDSKQGEFKLNVRVLDNSGHILSKEIKVNLE